MSNARPEEAIAFADRRLWPLAGLIVATLAGLLVSSPIPQDPAYHVFADRRLCIGVPNFANVVSNVGFAVVGLWGLWLVLGRKRRALFARPGDRWPYITFFVGVAALSAGSAYYHAAPDDARLFWDRLPMTLAFMGLFAGIVADRVDRQIGLRWILPLGVAFGVASLLYWLWTEAQGRGDLRLYGLVQFLPIAAVPLIAWKFPARRYTHGRDLVSLFLWYAVAKVLEHLDGPVLSWTTGLVSGHSLKHLGAAMATFVVLRMIQRGASDQRSAAVPS